MLGALMGTLASEALLAADQGSDIGGDIACYMLEAVLGDVVRPHRWHADRELHVSAEHQVFAMHADSGARNAPAGSKACQHGHAAQPDWRAAAERGCTCCRLPHF